MPTKRPPRRPNVSIPLLRRLFTDERARDLKLTRELHSRVHRTLAASPWSNPDVVRDGLTRIILDHLDSLPAGHLVPVVERTIREIVGLERVICDFPADVRFETLTLKEQVELRRFLRAKEHFLANDEKIIGLFITTLVECLAAVIALLPDCAEIGAATFTVPLADLLHDTSQLVELIIRHFAQHALADAGLFVDLAQQLHLNLCTASGIDPSVDTRKAFKFPSGDLSPAEIVASYLDRTPFQGLLSANVRFQIPRDSYAEHGAILAPSGHGKTQALQSIALDFLNEPDPPAMFVIDSMGAMLERIAQLDVFNTRLKDRLLILDPADAPALNFFQLDGVSEQQRAELFFYLFKAIEQGLTPRQATMVAYLAELMRAIDGATLDTLRQVCEAKTLPFTAELARLPQIARDFFRHQFMSKDQLINATKSQIAARLYTIGRNTTFNTMFSATTNRFNAFDCIARKKIVLVNTDRYTLGDSGSAIFGRFVLAQCLAAAFARAPIPERERHLALIICDEAKAYLDDQSEKIFSDARQFKLGMLLATQAPHQLPETVRREVANNTSIKLLGPVPYEVASGWSRDMHTSVEFIQSMRTSKAAGTAEFACYVRNVTPRAIKVSIPLGALEKSPRMTDAQYVAMRARNKAIMSAAKSAMASGSATERHADLVSEANNPEPQAAAPKPTEPAGPTELDVDH